MYDNFWVRVTLVDIQTPDGKRFEHHVVRLKTVAIAAVLDDEDRVLMLWRYRFATDEWGWELPGGIADAGEDAAVAAGREVLEEIGWQPGPLEHLFTFQPMPGMVDTPHALFVAQAAEKVAEPTDLEEAGVVDWVPMSQVRELIARGEVLGVRLAGGAALPALRPRGGPGDGGAGRSRVDRSALGPAWPGPAPRRGRRPR